MRKLTAFTSGMALLLAAAPLLASSRVTIPQDEALEKPLQITLTPGSPFTVDFSATDQCIQSIFPGDRSRYVYRTEIPINAGCSTILNLLQIEQVKFPGATRATKPSLQVVTLDNSQEKRLYTLTIGFGNSPQRTLAVVPATAPALSAGARSPQVFRTARGFDANVSAFGKGLDISIARGFTTANDPAVGRVREFLVLLQNNPGLSIQEAATQVGLSLEFINALAELGLKAQAREQQERFDRAAGPVNVANAASAASAANAASVANAASTVEPSPRSIRAARGLEADVFVFERGLDVSIERGLTRSEDPAAGQVREFLVLLHSNPELSVEDAAARVGLGLDFINSLAELGFRAKARERFAGVEAAELPISEKVAN